MVIHDVDDLAVSLFWESSIWINWEWIVDENQSPRIFQNWMCPKMGVPKVTMGFNTESLSNLG